MAFTPGFCVGPKILGVDLANKHTVAQHPVGTTVYDHKGRTWVYIKAGGTIGLGNLVKAASADDPYTSAVIATASNAATFILGMSGLALVANDFAFIVAHGIFEDDAQIVTASIAPGDPFISDANGDCTIAVETDINNARGICLVDDADNTGTVLLF